MKLRNVLLAASLGVLPAAAANAQFAGPASTWEGIYVGALGGYNMLEDIDLPTGGKAEFDGGWAALARVGYGWKFQGGLGLGLELEGSYRSNDADSVSILGSSAGGGGDNKVMAAMVNAVVSYDLGPNAWNITPYIGAGVGYAWNELSVRNQGITVVDDTEGHFAYQGMVGLAFPIAAVPGLSLNAEYRYFALLEESYSTSSAFRAAGGVSSVDVETANHTFLVGLTYAFGMTPPPPPPPPAAAAPAPARTYLVFFDFDSSALTDRARQIIGEAAANAPRVQTTRIEVTGHTDTVGTAAYNQALSVRRANAVAAELERRGIPRSQMTITGRGFSQPLVPTGANVREPQNRRVEIVLR
ncbi:OmpA family protein [Elioraea rosea]|uniref:OmpA family protein n=1 Tax=Elioraea rosea TaxID=2492390 RepID=UPI0011838586|nr:OmpA family protein [Elioraea rosea]